MFAMAEANGVYLIFNFGGDNNASGRFDRVSNGFGWGQSDPTSGNIYEVGSETYSVFVNWSGEVMRHYQNETSLAMWEIWNEPDNDALYLNYWSLLPDPDSAWYNWSHNVSDDFKAQDDHHLIINGFESGLFYGWGQGNFNALNNNSVDVSVMHFYTDAEDDYLVYWRDCWSDALNKPLFFDEAGLSDSGPPWGIYYWPWLDAECTAYNISVAWLTLIDYPGYPISAGTMASIPPVPGYVPPPTWAPTITSSPVLSGQQGIFYSYHIMTNETCHFTTLVLQGWLSAISMGSDWTDAYLNGTPTASGSFDLEVGITSISGTEEAYQNYSLDIIGIWAPTFTNSASSIGTVGSIYWYIPACNESVTFNLTTKPSWASMSGGGTISGTPLVGGSFDFELSATSINGTLDAWNNWSVAVPTLLAPTWNATFISTPVISVIVNVSYSYTPHLNESGTITVLSMPTWMVYVSGTLSGIPNVTGSFNVSLRAYSTAGTEYSYQNWTAISSVPDNNIWEPNGGHPSSGGSPGGGGTYVPSGSSSKFKLPSINPMIAAIAAIGGVSVVAALIMLSGKGKPGRRRK
jgi:hypothetical protein